MSSPIIVIGAGPAGLMAAGQAAGLGARVILLEKMPKPALKLGLTGKGRCNVTNTAPLQEFIQAFGPQGRFLHPAFSRFFCPQLREFLDRLGVATHVERGGRVFPSSEDAPLVARTLVDWAQSQGVKIRTRSRVTDIETSQGQTVGVRIQGRGESASLVETNAVILATGGASYPGTGSTGEGYELARRIGHTVQPIYPALVPLEVEERETVRKLQGLSLRNVQVWAECRGKTLGTEFGELLFTHFGLSGPVILSLSREVVRAWERGQEVNVHIDLKPALDEQKLDARLVRDFRDRGRQKLKNVLKGLLPAGLIPICLEQTALPEDKSASQLTNRERRILRSWFKDVRFSVSGHRSFAEAIVTAGGVSTREVDPRSMESKLVKGMFLAGEVLDLAGTTGGYNLQAAFSTGWLAGQSAAKLREQRSVVSPASG
ncbi:MAG: NAD(P)/FAD-dependent oxidoreductase [Desulfovermiculus sp.]|nr:NAD(P)/FAD-dependent oxidoreductase [Desulfovermiculus sp.]